MTPADETTLLLQEWSRWIWYNRDLHLSYPTMMTPFKRLQGSTVAEPMISDPVAGEVDHAVARLCVGRLALSQAALSVGVAR